MPYSKLSFGISPVERSIKNSLKVNSHFEILYVASLVFLGFRNCPRLIGMKREDEESCSIYSSKKPRAI